MECFEWGPMTKSRFEIWHGFVDLFSVEDVSSMTRMKANRGNLPRCILARLTCASARSCPAAAWKYPYAFCGSGCTSSPSRNMMPRALSDSLSPCMFSLVIAEDATRLRKLYIKYVLVPQRDRAIASHACNLASRPLLSKPSFQGNQQQPLLGL